MWKFEFVCNTRRGESKQSIAGPMKKKKKPAPYVMHDEYFKKAKQEWYRARSVYKLIAIQDQFEIIKQWMNICDVWAAPGSFIQYIKKIIKDTGQIVWIDLKPILKYSQTNINTIVHSIFDFETLKPKVEEFIWEWKKFDLITSDIAPNTTWRKDVDQFASVELNIAILEFADVFLKKGWNVLLKVFKWEDFNDLIQVIQKKYIRFTEHKPKACRDRSFEEYVICYWKK
jgi:23S rRNA (uridine2552-2'-O)-methyltransferase